MCDNDTGNNGAVGGGNGHSKAHRPPHKARDMGESKQMAMGERLNVRARLESIQPRWMKDNDGWKLCMAYSDGNREYVESEYKGEEYRKINQEGLIWVYQKAKREKS